MTKQFIITRKDGSQWPVEVDADDFDAVVAAGPWCVKTSKTGKTYYATHHIRYPDGSLTTQQLHRFLWERWGLPGTPDGNGWRNTRDNLRAATSTQNNQNRGLRIDNNSGYIGVTWNKSKVKWQAQAEINGKNHHIGLFATAESAARARDAYVLLHQDTAFVRLNFPAANDNTAISREVEQS